MDKEQPQSVAAHLTNMLARIPAAQADEQAEHAKDEDTAFFADEVDLAEAELFCDGASGIYIPQRFAQEVKRSLVDGVSVWAWLTLEAGPEHEDYWMAWEQVLDNARLTHPTLGECHLYQDGDLWVVPCKAEVAA
jgi:hypothetical protein